MAPTITVDYDPRGDELEMLQVEEEEEEEGEEDRDAGVHGVGVFVKGAFLYVCTCGGELCISVWVCRGCTASAALHVYPAALGRLSARHPHAGFGGLSARHPHARFGGS
jgi:hypothetical protein